MYAENVRRQGVILAFLRRFKSYYVYAIRVYVYVDIPVGSVLPETAL